MVALGSSIVAGEVFHSGRPEHMGYPIEGVEQESEDGAEAEKPIAFYLASADPAKGEQVFKKCIACHNADKGGANALGPNLWGMLGAPVGKGHGFAFSDALASKGGSWNWENLSEWLKSPKSFAPGTKMTFAGLSSPEDRAAVILFLNQHSDSPQPLPAPPAAPPGSETAGGDAGKPAAAAEGSQAQKEPVLNNTAADVKGGGEAAQPGH
ncbi:MAG TPA: cytochrome c family protein [Sphingomicrobium sp.]|nr:cytochrome c family protein [Sphingomicrobium sp.]